MRGFCWREQAWRESSLVLDEANRVLLRRGDVYLASEQITDVLHIVVDHSGALETETPGDHRDILRKAHGFEHLGAEDT